MSHAKHEFILEVESIYDASDKKDEGRFAHWPTAMSPSWGKPQHLEN